jgi:hypothetical protein
MGNRERRQRPPNVDRYTVTARELLPDNKQRQQSNAPQRTAWGKEEYLDSVFFSRLCDRLLNSVMAAGKKVWEKA